MIHVAFKWQSSAGLGALWGDLVMDCDPPRSSEDVDRLRERLRERVGSQGPLTIVSWQTMGRDHG